MDYPKFIVSNQKEESKIYKGLIYGVRDLLFMQLFSYLEVDPLMLMMLMHLRINQKLDDDPFDDDDDDDDDDSVCFSLCFQISRTQYKRTVHWQEYKAMLLMLWFSAISKYCFL